MSITTWPSHLAAPLPCPACEDNIAYEDGLHSNGSGQPPSYQVCCGNCGASGPYGRGRRRNDHDGAKNDAITEWNAMPRKPTVIVINNKDNLCPKLN